MGSGIGPRITRLPEVEEVGVLEESARLLADRDDHHVELQRVEGRTQTVLALLMLI